jgi:hypothetical protein
MAGTGAAAAEGPVFCGEIQRLYESEDISVKGVAVVVIMSGSI